MKIVNWIIRELCFAGLSREEFQQVREPVAERNRQTLVSWSGWVGLFWIMSLVFSIGSEAYAACRIVYAAALAVCIISMLCGLFLIKRVPRILPYVMYLFEFSVLGAGIGIAVCQPDVRTATMIAVAVVIPLCFLDVTVTSIIQQAITIIAYVIFGSQTIVPDIYSWGLTNLIIFSVAGILIGHVINKSRYERFVYADSAAKLAEMRKTYNKELEKEVAAKTEQIEAVHGDLVLGIATLVESRDNSTGGHIRRTSTGVKILTETILEDGSLHLSKEFCKKIVKAAPMHDLGKIAVDDAILRKPGRYVPEEYEEMKTHAAKGAYIVHEIMTEAEDEEFRQITENIAHYHHERMDGTGYPEGLKGEEIPIEARIMAIADVYDALVSKRVYKEKYSFEKADKIILEGMGTQFDPQLRTYYEKARPKLEAYYAKEQEQE